MAGGVTQLGNYGGWSWPFASAGGGAGSSPVGFGTGTDPRTATAASPFGPPSSLSYGDPNTRPSGTAARPGFVFNRHKRNGQEIGWQKYIGGTLGGLGYEPSEWIHPGVPNPKFEWWRHPSAAQSNDPRIIGRPPPARKRQPATT